MALALPAIHVSFSFPTNTMQYIFRHHSCTAESYGDDTKRSELRLNLYPNRKCIHDAMGYREGDVMCDSQAIYRP